MQVEATHTASAARRHHRFKDRLLALSQEIGLSFVIAHYPPYTSKWNGSGQPSY